MAKWGEGDPRWLVEERPDATNPNNWHWVEKNATRWSKERLNDLFAGQALEKGAIKVNFTELSKLEGEATANNRKAKLIFLFEWVLNLKFNARVSGSDIEYTGFLEVPNLSDENSHDEVDINVTIDTKGPHEAELRHMLADSGLNFVRSQCEVYIRELKEEFSKGLILPTDKNKPQIAVTKNNASVINKSQFQNEVISSTASKKPSTESSSKVSSVSQLNLTETFKVPPERLYEFLTSEEMVKAWSGRDAVIVLKEGGKFSLLGGQISGLFEKLQPNKKIEMKWRLKKYPENYYAHITLMLRDQNDSTDLVVESSDIPEEHFSDTQTGFTRYYFQSIIRTFGVGLTLF